MYNVDAQDNQETRILYFTGNDANTIKSVYSKIKNDSALPEMEIITVSDENYTGLYWDGNQNEAVWYTPYGRFFSAEEMDSGADVTLLGTDFFKNLPQEKVNTIWKAGIEINSTRCIAIGNYYFVYTDSTLDDSFYKSLLIHTPITVPLKTYFDIGLIPKRFRCIFSQPLTNEQIIHLSDLLKPFGDIKSLSLPKSYEVSAVNAYINGIATYIIVLVLSMLSAVNIILYWLRKEFVRYRIYLICGAKGKQIAYFISLNVALLVTITYICAYFAVSGLTKITPQGIVTALPWQFNILIYIGVMIFMLVAVNIRAIPIVFREKMLQK